LVGDAVPDNIPHGNSNARKDPVEDQAVGDGNLNGKIIDKIENGKVDSHDESPQTEINGNGTFID
jgi:hypothetical protein